MKTLLTIFILLSLTGCMVPQCERRLGEGIKVRGAKIAADETLPLPVRQEGERIDKGMLVLQKRLVPAPATQVLGTPQEFDKDLQDSSLYEEAFAALKLLPGKLIETMSSQGGIIGGIGAALTLLMGLYAKSKKTAETVANKALEARSRLADFYQAAVPEGEKAKLDAELAAFAQKHGISVEEITKWKVWMATPDKIS